MNPGPGGRDTSQEQERTALRMAEFSAGSGTSNSAASIPVGGRIISHISTRK